MDFRKIGIVTVFSSNPLETIPHEMDFSKLEPPVSLPT
jgi:hypothetical protein